MNLIKWIMNIFRKHKPKPPAPTGIQTAIKPTIAIINATTVLQDSDVTPVVQAMQVAVSRDYAAMCGVDAALIQVPKGGTAPAGAWWMVLMDTSDVQGALGYHEDTTPEDLPIGKIFVKTCMDDNAPWSTCLGHELYEALGDPQINKCAQDANGLIYAWENCDAVEETSYEINGIPMTNFVTDAWFNPQAPAGSRFDFLGLTSQPFQLLPGGYISVLDPNNGAGWGIITADKKPGTLYSSRPSRGSRRQRRQIGHANWIRHS